LRIAIYVNSRTSPLDFLIHMRDTLASGIIELPAFPQVVIKVQEAYKDPNYTPQLVARLISAEPIEPQMYPVCNHIHTILDSLGASPQ
jgi:hypothetical protein